MDLTREIKINKTVITLYQFVDHRQVAQSIPNFLEKTQKCHPLSIFKLEIKPALINTFRFIKKSTRKDTSGHKLRKKTLRKESIKGISSKMKLKLMKNWVFPSM